jgi:5-formyltetrahydrofolate cyclo-ligase
MTDPPALTAWRREQRALLLAARQAMSTAAHRIASRALAERLGQELQQPRPSILGGYWPIRREFNPLPLMQQLLGQGVHIALPAMLARDAPLQFRLWQPGTRLAVGSWGIPYPADGATVLPDTLIVPLLGFDLAGYRLGYGGGYYDRTIAALSPAPRLLGVGFAAARLATIYPQSHDIRMHRIITDSATLDPSLTSAR